MGFIKDGETKVYKDKIIKEGENSSTQKKERVRYTIDDLVRDTDGPEKEVEDTGDYDVS